MKRLFFALWPTQTSRDQIQLVSDAFQQDTTRQVPKHNLHITLFFIGNIDHQNIPLLMEKASLIRNSKIALVFNELDFWRRPKILCLSCQRQTTPLYQLVNSLNQLAKTLSFQIESRPFRAHITIARKAHCRPKSVFEPIEMCFDRFSLIESTSTEEGVLYSELCSWPLGEE
ncbi:hypothetical protein LCGC14_0797270 [marine sediment metagenome]|uniref:Phosphoesterase HXTX domain-containing protein n=1 Tax=marine sediment metagenome TaxID=412755 RepID=A0A0F9PQM8_9ZZZZ